MKMTLRNATLAVALAAVGATAYATTDYVTTSYSDLEKDTVVAYNEPIAAPAEPVVTETTVTTTETLVAPAPVYAPVVEQSVAQPPLTIEDRRLTEDQRIQALVMDKLAAAPNISGKIGVESNQQVVTLSGYTVTAAQGQRAGRLAGSVDGVKSVNNELRARIGGSV